MNADVFSPQALNKAMREAVDFIHAEGWDQGPTLFALVPTDLLVDNLDADDAADSPLTLVVQDNIPDNLLPGSEALGDYISRLAWPSEVAGVVLAQEIMFTDSSVPGSAARPARLFSGVLRGDAELTLLQLRPTEEELAERGPFSEDEVELRGGPGVAPGVITALRYTLEAEPEDF